MKRRARWWRGEDRRLGTRYTIYDEDDCLNLVRIGTLVLADGGNHASFELPQPLPRLRTPYRAQGWKGLDLGDLM